MKIPGFLVLVLGPVLVACEGSQATVDPAATVAAAAAEVRTGPAAKVVFVGKERACDCTQKAVDAGWAALETALGKPPRLPVERLQIDTNAEQVAPYRASRALLALPGIYLVDAKGVVVELLQGEVSAEQLAAALEKTGAPAR